MHIKTTICSAALASFVTPGLVPTALGQDYEHVYQEPVGGRASFFVEGPATGNDPDVQGDARLEHVEMPNGETFSFFYMPVHVADVHFQGDRTRFLVRGGTRTTSGVQGDYAFPDVDTEDPDMSASDRADLDAFRVLMLKALRNANLNSYVDVGSNAIRLSFILKFNMVVTDNDPDPDDFGEILYFERGAGSGNSWLKMRAVDEDGAALGPWLVIGPNETVQTTPQTTVYRPEQKVGTTAVDVSRLGVTEFQYLEVSNDVTAEPAYTGGGDLSPDFKLMAVITDAQQITDALGIYD